MTYTAHRAEDQETFILNPLLPLIGGHARTIDTSSVVVVMAAWLRLSTILQAKSLGRDTLLKALDAARLDVHEAPEGLH